MKGISGTLAAAIASGKALKPIAQVTLYRTPRGDDLLGPGVMVWRGMTTPSGDPWLGERVAYPAADPWESDELILADKGQLADFWGAERPFGLPVSEACVVRFEGYYRHPFNGSVEFLLVGNGDPVKFFFGTGAQAPADATERISYSADHNIDQAAGQTYVDSGLTMGQFYAMAVEVSLPAGGYGKVSLLYRQYGSGDPWRLVDASVVSVRPTAEASYELPGISEIKIEEEIGKPALLTLSLVFDPLYEYDPSTDAWGILRVRSRLVVKEGYQTSAGDELIQRGEFYIDRVDHTDGEEGIELSITARDALGRAADATALLYPDVLDYDRAGYSSSDVWIEPDAVSRYTAFDSWTLAETIRSLLYKAGLSSRQLHAETGFPSEPLISEKGIRLDRGSLYRLRLPQVEKNEDLRYAPEPGTKLLPFILDIVETFGYRFRVNASGEVILQERDNGTAYSVESGEFAYSGTWGAITDAIDAHAGAERTAAGAATVSIAPSDSPKVVRLFFRREPGSSATFSLTVGGQSIASGVALDYGRPWSWRDGFDPSSGLNPSVFEYRGIPTGQVVVDVTAGAVFQGVELIVPDAEEAATTFDGDRETIETAVVVDAVRNDVIVAGAELGPDTAELVLSRAVDVGSIGRPKAPNFVGERRVFILTDDRIGRQEQAEYTAFRNLRKYRTLSDAVTVPTIGRPELDLEDAALVFDVDTLEQLPGTRFIDKISSTWTAEGYLASVRLNPYPPLESYRLPLAPISPPGMVTEFKIERTDGESIDPDLFAGNEITYGQYPGRPAGVYCPQWAEEVDSIFLRISLKVWQPGFLTLEVKDLLTHRTVAVLAEDRFVDWGAQSFLWGGRWFSADGSSYLYYPQAPDQTEQDWSDYQDGKDPVVGGDRGRAGWVYVEARFDPIEVSDSADLFLAENADDPARSHVHVILGPKAASLGISLYYLQPVYAKAITPDFVPYGGRYDVYLDEWIGSGLPRGIRITIGHLYEDVRYTISGYLDAYVVVYESDDWTDGIQVFYIPQEWNAESLARGRHLWSLDGTPVLVQGETDFLAPGNYEFLLDPMGLPVIPDPDIEASGRRFSVETANVQGGTRSSYKLEFREKVEIPRQRLTYRDNYLDFVASLFPGKIVGVGFHAGSKLVAYNRAGERMTGPIEIWPIRLENPDYAAHKHAVWPPTTVGQGGTTVYPGLGIRLRRRKVDNDSDLNGRAPHLTLPSGVSGNLAYD